MSKLYQRYWWHLRNTNQEYTSGTRYSSTMLAFTRVTQKPKVMSPQTFPRDVGINCGMTIDQTSWRGNLSIWPRKVENPPAEHKSLDCRTYLATVRKYSENSERVTTHVRPILSTTIAAQVEQFPNSRRPRTSPQLDFPRANPSSSTVYE